MVTTRGWKAAFRYFLRTIHGVPGADVGRSPAIRLRATAGRVPLSLFLSAPITRILSDFHYTDPSTWVRRLPDAAPLLDGPERVVMNGDTLDTRVHPHPSEIVAEVKQFFREHVADTVFIAGNHDPDISPDNELSLAAGRIWITHGHVFFDDMAPWGRLAPEIRRRIRGLTGTFPPAGFDQLEKRFELFREISTSLPPEHDPHQHGTLAKWRRLAYAVFPPHQIISMLRAWLTLPKIAFKVAEEQRPAARVIITGHTHYPGAWTAADGRVFLNTGSFGPPRGARLVDLMEDRILMRTILRRGREFHPGPTVREIALAPTSSSTLSASP